MENFLDLPKATGEVTLTHRDENGKLLFEATYKNLVVTTGLSHIATRMTSTPGGTMTHMGLGTGATAAALSQDALITPATGGPSSNGRVALTTSGGVATTNQIKYDATFGAGIATAAIVEAGIFPGSTGTGMLCRTTFPVINKGPNDSLAVAWTVTVS